MKIKKLKLLTLILLLVFILSGCNIQKKQNTNYNNNQDIQMINKSFSVNDGVLKIQTIVINTTDKDCNIGKYNIILKDENGKEIQKVFGYVGDIIKSKETREVETSVNIDNIDFKYIEYEINK